MIFSYFKCSYLNEQFGNLLFYAKPMIYLHVLKKPYAYYMQLLWFLFMVVVVRNHPQKTPAVFISIMKMPQPSNSPKILSQFHWELKRFRSFYYFYWNQLMKTAREMDYKSNLFECIAIYSVHGFAIN